MSGRPRLLVIGNGMVGLRFVEELLARDAGCAYEVTVIGGEPRPAYNRVLLSPFLAGEIAEGDVALKPEGWYRAHGVELLLGCAVASLDARYRAAVLSDGRRIPFDLCVLATGSAPIRLPLPGSDAPGVHTFRDRDDVAAMTAFAETGRPAAVIGGGLLGIETAYGLARAGVAVTLVHLLDRLMERQLDAEAAALVKTALEAKGVEVLLNAATEAIETDAAGCAGLRLKDGRRIEAGLVAMAVGVAPKTGLARSAGLPVGRGVQIDDACATADPQIFAIGECAEHRGRVYGLVEPGYAQARVLADRLTGGGARYEGSVLATNLKLSGVPVFSAGDFLGADAETLVARDAELGVYRKFCVAEDRLTGVVLVGDTTDALWYQELIGSGAPIAAIRSVLPFGKAFAEAA